MANSMEPHATGAGYKVTHTGENRRRGGGEVGWRVAAGADDIRAIRVTRHRRAQEHIASESNGEVLRVREGEEGLMRKARASVREPAPEAKGPSRHTPIKQPGTTSGSGVIRVI